MNGFESALGHVGHGPLGPNFIWSDRWLTLARISELAFLPHRATEPMLAWWYTQLDRRRFVYDTYTVSQKSEPPKHFATAAANLHRFKWNFIHTRRHLFLSSTSNFIRIPYSLFQTAGVKINGSYYRDTLLRQQLLPAIRSVSGDFFTFQQDSAQPTVPVRWLRYCQLRHPTSSATEQGWTFWLFWLTSTVMETHDLWVMLFKN